MSITRAAQVCTYTFLWIVGILAVGLVGAVVLFFGAVLQLALYGALAIGVIVLVIREVVQHYRSEPGK